MTYLFLSPVSLFKKTLLFSTITYLNNGPETTSFFTYFMLIDKIRSFSENIKREKEKIPQNVFFRAFRNILGQFCLKVIPEIKSVSTCT